MQPVDQQPIAYVPQPDLIFQPRQFQGSPCWIVKDPLGLKYFRMESLEYRLIRNLDGRVSLRTLHDILQQEFPQREISLADIHRQIQRFALQGLLRSTAADQGRSLLARKRSQRYRRLRESMPRLLSIRLPGFDPQYLLEFLYPCCRWMFRRSIVLATMAWILSAILLLVSNGNEFLRRLPDLESFFRHNNLLTLAFLLIGTKILHELGHAMACHHFGGRCREIGLMLLVFMPTLYCDVTDSWLLPSKWKRIAIGGAGMYVEAVIAASATWIWWFTQPGWWHFISLNLMFLCSVNSVLFNGNPLLRYDAYFMLSDWLEIPNLAQRSRQVLMDRIRSMMLGIPQSSRGLVPYRFGRIFLLYGVASFLFRWLIVVSILWFIHGWFESVGLGSVGTLVIILVGISILGPLVGRLFRWWQHTEQRRSIRGKRASLVAFLAIILAWFLVAWPLPCWVIGHFQLLPGDATRVYMKTTARIIGQPVVAGEQVQQGDEILHLDRSPLRLEIAVLQTRSDRLKYLIQQRTRTMHAQNLGMADRSRQQQEWEEIQRQLADLRRRLNDLKLVAPQDGVVFPAPPIIPPLPVAADEYRSDLPTWSGDPLDPHNLGAALNPETHVCWVGQPDRWQAEIYLKQSDIGTIQQIQKVDLLLDAYPGESITGTVIKVANRPLTTPPATMMSTVGGPLSIKLDSEPRSPKTVLTWYPVTVRLDATSLPLRVGLNGRARIRLPDQTFAQQFYRWAAIRLRFR